MTGKRNERVKKINERKSKRENKGKIEKEGRRWNKVKHQKHRRKRNKRKRGCEN